jgi:hypothetical protein
LSPYEKLGVLVLRLVAILAVGMGFLVLAYHSLVSAIGASLPPDAQDRFSGSAWYIGAGILLFLLSGPLGRMLGRNLE